MLGEFHYESDTIETDGMCTALLTGRTTTGWETAQGGGDRAYYETEHEALRVIHETTQRGEEAFLYQIVDCMRVSVKGWIPIRGENWYQVNGRVMIAGKWSTDWGFLRR